MPLKIFIIEDRKICYISQLNTFQFRFSENIKLYFLCYRSSRYNTTTFLNCKFSILVTQYFVRWDKQLCVQNMLKCILAIGKINV